MGGKASFPKLDWKFEEIWERPVLVIDKDEIRGEITVLDLEHKLPYTVDVPSVTELRMIERGKIYRMKIKVYTAKQTAEIKRTLEKIAKNDEEVRGMITLIEKLGGGEYLFRFELLEVLPVGLDMGGIKRRPWGA